VKVARWLSAPALIWFLAFIFAPLIVILAMSLADRNPYGQITWGFYLSNYAKLFNFGILKIFAKTLVFAGSTAIVCAMLGLLAAWAIASAPRAKREIYLVLIVVPFLTNGLIRILGLKTFVAVDGPLDHALSLLAIPHDPFSLSANVYLVGIGMLICCLPFAVLPLYGAFEKFDFSLVEAAQDLGAGQFTILSKVVLPVLFKPFLSAFFLVLIPCLGEYLIPDLLGGARTQLLGNLITEKFLKARDWPMGATLAIVLIFGLLAGGIVASLIRKRQAA
jgi:spermidine/putrescine transport system permease protein